MLDDRPHPGKEPVITIEAKAWLTSLTMQSNAHQSPRLNSLLTGKLTGNFVDSGLFPRFGRPVVERIQWLAANSLRNGTGNFFRRAGNFLERTGNFITPRVSVHFSHACLFGLRTRSVLTGKFAGEE